MTAGLAPVAVQTVPPLVRRRNHRQEDVPLIFSSWLKSYAKALGLRGAERAAHFKAKHAAIESILGRRGCSVIVACDPSAIDEVWGYVVLEDTDAAVVVHWLYVKHVFRRFGIGAGLLTLALSPTRPLHHSHQTEAGAKLASRFNSTFHPEAAP